MTRNNEKPAFILKALYSEFDDHASVTDWNPLALFFILRDALAECSGSSLGTSALAAFPQLALQGSVKIAAPMSKAWHYHLSHSRTLSFLSSQVQNLLPLSQEREKGDRRVGDLQ